MKNKVVLEVKEVNPIGTCALCGGKLHWQGDYTFEDYCIEGEGLVSTWKCSGCGADVTFELGDEEDEN